jgi:hypothetical protein
MEEVIGSIPIRPTNNSTTYRSIVPGLAGLEYPLVSGISPRQLADAERVRAFATAVRKHGGYSAGS